MKIQSIPSHNYNTQFNGKLAVYDRSTGYDMVSKIIPESADKILYDSFIKLLGENIGKEHRSSNGSYLLNKQAMAEFIGFINSLFDQYPQIIKYFDENPKCKLFDCFYVNDGKGNLQYEISVNKIDVIVKHELHREGY